MIAKDFYIFGNISADTMIYLSMKSVTITN